MIVDTHVHYWQPNLPDRPWDPGGVNIGTPLGAEELLAQAVAAGVDRIVQVTPTVMGYDNRYSFECAHRFGEQIVGAFARFDPTAPEMPRRLAALRAEPAFLGVRLTLMKPPWDRWLADGTLDPFWEEAARQDVAVAAFAPGQAALLHAAARRHPEVHLLVDHMALDYHHGADPFATWDETLALAAEPNVWIKVSAFPEASRERYPFPDVQPYFRQLYERVGPQRLIWGSNYPPSAQAASYRESVDFVRELAFLSEADRDQIMGGTFLRLMSAGLSSRP